eukprot:scaffold323_cov232-Pinguiococcus_pyrenoidosus.AAC.17
MQDWGTGFAIFRPRCRRIAGVTGKENGIEAVGEVVVDLDLLDLQLDFHGCPPEALRDAQADGVHRQVQNFPPRLEGRGKHHPVASVELGPTTIVGPGPLVVNYGHGDSRQEDRDALPGLRWVRRLIHDLDVVGIHSAIALVAAEAVLQALLGFTVGLGGALEAMAGKHVSRRRHESQDLRGPLRLAADREEATSQKALHILRHRDAHLLPDTVKGRERLVASSGYELDPPWTVRIREAEGDRGLRLDLPSRERLLLGLPGVLGQAYHRFALDLRQDLPDAKAQRRLVLQGKQRTAQLHRRLVDLCRQVRLGSKKRGAVHDAHELAVLSGLCEAHIHLQDQLLADRPGTLDVVEEDVVALELSALQRAKIVPCRGCLRVAADSQVHGMRAHLVQPQPGCTPRLAHAQQQGVSKLLSPGPSNGQGRRHLLASRDMHFVVHLCCSLAHLDRCWTAVDDDDLRQDGHHLGAHRAKDTRSSADPGDKISPDVPARHLQLLLLHLLELDQGSEVRVRIDVRFGTAHRERDPELARVEAAMRHRAVLRQPQPSLFGGRGRGAPDEHAVLARSPAGRKMLVLPFDLLRVRKVRLSLVGNLHHPCLLLFLFLLDSICQPQECRVHDARPGRRRRVRSKDHLGICVDQRRLEELELHRTHPGSWRLDEVRLRIHVAGVL